MIRWEKTESEYFEKCDTVDGNQWIEMHDGTEFARFVEVPAQILFFFLLLVAFDLPLTMLHFLLVVVVVSISTSFFLFLMRYTLLNFFLLNFILLVFFFFFEKGVSRRR